MNKLYTTIIVLGIITEVALLIFFDKKIAAYGPVIFWAIALFGILHYGANIFKLSDSVKKRIPELYKRYSFGLMITRNAFSDDNFLGALIDNELKIIKPYSSTYLFALDFLRFQQFSLC